MERQAGLPRGGTRSVGAAALACCVAIALLLGACSRSEERVIVAGIDDLQITDKHYLVALKRYYKDTGQAINLSRDVKEAVLRNLLDRYAGVKFAQDRGWDADEEALFKRELIERKVLMEEYQRRMIFDDVFIEDGDLRKLFLRLNTELRASHLYAPTREQADSLHRLIEAGADFEELAGRIFRSARLAEGGGDLGYFTVDDMDVAFEDAAYRLEIGEISSPVRTSTGFSIIKLTDRRTRPIITENEYANARARIYPLAVDQKKELATRADIESTVRRFDIPADLVRQLWEVIRSDTREGMTEYVVLGPLPPPHQDLGERKLVRQAGFELTVNDFLREAFYTLPEDWNEIREFHHFRDFLEGVVYRSYAIHRIRNSDRMDRGFVEGSIQETFHSYLYRRFDDYLERAVEITQEDLRREYEEHRAEYVAPVALNLRELGVTSREEAEAAMEMLERGVSFFTVFNRFAADDRLREWNGELGFIDLDRFGTLSVPLADVRPGELRGPFQLQENRFVIFKCIDRREQRQLSFEEAEPKARDYLLHIRKEEARKRLLEEIKEEYDAFMDLEKLDQLTLEL